MAEFARAFPAWVGESGAPLSWRHFVAGLRHLTQHHAREQIRTHDAVGMTNAKDADRKAWLRDVKLTAGW